MGPCSSVCDKTLALRHEHNEINRLI